jgi:hypothetical protein
MICVRRDGTERKWFRTEDEAVAFEQDPANHPCYRGDVAHLCDYCNRWHLSRVEWLVPAHLRRMETVN